MRTVTAIFKKRWLKRTLWALGGITLCAGIGLMAAFLWLSSSSGKSWALQTVQAQLKTEGHDIKISALEGSLFSTFTLKDISIADKEGVWLTSPALTVSWQPLSLVSGTLSLTSLTGAQGTLVRFPKSETKTQPTTAAPRLPFAISLAGLDLPLSYQATNYAIKGKKLFYSSRAAAVALTVTSPANSDMLRLAFTWYPHTGTIDVDSRLKAHQGGLLGDLFALKKQETITAYAKGQGPLDNWQGRFAVNSIDKLALEGQIHSDSAGWRVSITQTSNRYIPASLAGLLAENTTLVIKLMEKDGTLGTLDLTGKSGTTGLHLTGFLETKNSYAFKGTYSLETPEIAYQAVTAKDLNVHGTLSYEKSSLEASYSLSAATILHEAGNASHLATEGTVSFKGDTIQGAVSALSASVDISGETIKLRSALGGWHYALAEGAWGVVLDSLDADTLKAAPFSLSGVGPKVNDLLLKASIAAKGLEHYSAGMITGGTLSLDGSMMAGVIKAHLTGAALTSSDAKLAALMGPNPEIALIANYGEDVTLKSFLYKGSGIEGSAQGTYTGQGHGLAISVDTRLTQVNGLSSGALEAPEGIDIKGEISGTLSNPHLTLQTRLKTLEGYGILLTDPKLDLTFFPQQAGIWAGSLHVEAASSYGPVLLNSPLSLSKTAFGAKAISLSLPIAKGTGALTWDKASGLEGQLILALTPGTLDGLTISGDADVTTKLTTHDTGLGVQLSLNAKDVSVAPSTGFPYQLDTAGGTVDLRLETSGLQYDANLTLENMKHGAQYLKTLSITGCSADIVPLTIKSNGYLENTFNIETSLTPSTTGARATFTLTYGDTIYRSLEPVVFAWSDGFVLEAPALSLAEGTASLKFSKKASDMSGALSLKGANMTLLNSFSPGLFQKGLMNADIHLVRSDRGENGSFSITMSDVQLPRFKSLLSKADTYALSLNGSLKDRQLSYDGHIDNTSQTLGTLQGSLPFMRTDKPFLYALRPNMPLMANIDWNGDITPLWLFIRQTDHMLSGTLDGHLSLSGDVDNPIFNGSLNLQKGRYEYLPLGLIAENLSVSLTGSEGRLKLNNISAKDTQNGTLSGSGYFELSPTLSFPGRIDVTLDKYNVSRLDLLNGNASANVRYERTTGGSSVSGTINTEKMTVAIPKELPSSVVTIDVTEINNGSDSMVALEKTKKARTKASALNLEVIVRDSLFVRGRGLASEWGGKLMLEGTTSEPKLIGTMKVKEGSFTFGSKIFTITTGSLQFKGGRTINPEVNITAEYSASSLNAKIQVSGSALNPTLSLSSVPSLPDDEIMSRILFGKSVTELSVLQVAEVVSALNTLRGSSSFNVVGKLRNTLGLDTLSITTDSENSGSTLVTGGKYLTDNIYVEIETSTATRETAPRLKVDITKNLLLETEVGPSQGSSLKLKWFWNY